jgi:hypothetical protein
MSNTVDQDTESSQESLKRNDIKAAALKAAQSLKDPERQKKALELAKKIGQKSKDMDVRATRREALQAKDKFQQKSKGQSFDR